MMFIKLGSVRVTYEKKKVGLRWGIYDNTVLLWRKRKGEIKQELFFFSSFWWKVMDEIHFTKMCVYESIDHTLMSDLNKSKMEAKAYIFAAYHIHKEGFWIDWFLFSFFSSICFKIWSKSHIKCAYQLKGCYFFFVWRTNGWVLLVIYGWKLGKKKIIEVIDKVVFHTFSELPYSWWWRAA